MVCGFITSWQIDGKTVETVSDFIFLAKSLQMMIAAMKLKDAYSLGEKYDQPSSVQFSSVQSLSRPHELQHSRPPCPSPTPRVHSDSHPSSR